MALKTASVLAFEKKLSNSDALMYSGNWQNRDNNATWAPIQIKSKDVRGTISNRLKAAIKNDPAKLNAEIEKPNLQRVDVAALPFDGDTLKVTFTLRVLGNLTQPSACNDQDYQEALATVINDYQTQNGFNELATRYATNIANGRFLWRNRIDHRASVVCGAGFFATFRRILIPMMRPGIMAGWIILATIFMREFSATLFLYSPSAEPLGPLLYFLYLDGMRGRVAAIGLVISVISIILIAIAQRFSRWEKS